MILVVLALLPHPGFSFSFDEYEKQEASSNNKKEVSLDQLNCPANIKSKTIATMIGESHRDDRPGYYRVFAYWNVADEPNWDRRFGTRKSVYGELVGHLNNSFHSLGLKTFSAEEINQKIAKEEQEAFLNNDLEAALSAASRLQADYLLKGNISTKAQINKVVKVDELFVTINLFLSDQNGRQLATAQISETAFSDADIPATVQKMIGAQANKIVYELFSNVCNGGN